MGRKVHLRPNQVLNIGHTKTACGRVIYGAPRDMSGAVVSFADFDATVHDTLVTCSRCSCGFIRKDQPHA